MEVGVEGLYLEVHDLAISKYVAGREKDVAFTRELARHRMTRKRVLAERLRDTALDPELRRIIARRIAADFRPRGRPRARR